MAAASWLAFGSESWHAFFASIGHTSQAFLSDGWADWSKLQTAFGLTRMLGGSETLAWTVQIARRARRRCRSRACCGEAAPAYEIKAAALATGALLATPYLYMYDLVVLAVPLAFLCRLGARGFLPHELTAIGVACLLIFIFPLIKAPLGFGAVAHRGAR